MFLYSLDISVKERLRKQYRRARLEFLREWPLFKDRFKTILFGACFQYVHAIFTQLAHRMATPTELPLQDLGFTLLPELGKQNEWVSELIFNTMLTSFLLWTFSPFWAEKKRFYTAVLYARVLNVLVVCQTLRIISFSVTTLPSPNYHCRLPQPTAQLAWPSHWWGHIFVNLQRQSTHGCGDLIFSSHTTFALVGVMSYWEYGTLKWVKALMWTGAAVLSTLIVSSRKHYTVDVLVAWYVVPLVFYTMHRRWTTKRPVKDDWLHRPEEAPLVELEEIVQHAGQAEAAGASQAAMHPQSTLSQTQRASPHDAPTSSSAGAGVFEAYPKPGQEASGRSGISGGGGSSSAAASNGLRTRDWGSGGEEDLPVRPPNGTLGNPIESSVCRIT